MKDVKFRIIAYNDDEACVDFIFIDKLNILQRLQLGCTKVQTAPNTYYIRTTNVDEFVNCLKSTIPCQASENSNYEFRCDYVEPRKGKSCEITFDALLSLVVRDFEIKSFDERNNFISQCKNIKQSQIEKTIKDGDDFVDRYEELCQ